MRAARTSLAVFFAAAVCACAAALAGTASAATCPSGSACGWVNPNFGTPRGAWATSIPSFGALSQPACPGGTWAGCISSDANAGTKCTVHFWTDAGYVGTEHSVARGVFEAFLGPNDNTFMSMNWC
jgi:Peptidase inhibitor family I36